MVFSKGMPRTIGPEEGIPRVKGVDGKTVTKAIKKLEQEMWKTCKISYLKPGRRR